eukprot:196555-Amphidinium_carterae.1
MRYSERLVAARIAGVFPMPDFPSQQRPCSLDLAMTGRSTSLRKWDLRSLRVMDHFLYVGGTVGLGLGQGLQRAHIQPRVP